MDEKEKKTVSLKQIEEKLESLVAQLKTDVTEQAAKQAREEMQAALDKIKEDLKQPAADKKDITTSPGEDGKKWKSFGQFAVAVKDACQGKGLDERLVRAPSEVFKTTGHLAEGTDSLGGFIVPEEQRMELMMLALEGAIVRPKAFILPMRSDTLSYPRIVDTTHASSVFGGVIAYRKAEAAALSESDVKLGQGQLRATKLTGFTYCSNELLADAAIGLDALLKRLFSDAIRYYEDSDFIVGTGAGEPLGIRNAACKVQVTRNTGSHFEYEDVANMMGRLLPVCWNKAVWLCSPAVVPDILMMENPSSGTGGHLIYQPMNQGAKVSPLPLQLLGRPVFVTEQVPTLGTADDVMLVDFSYYIIGDREDLAIQTSEHYRFANDETTYRFILRNDGQPWLNSALTPKNSGDTLSPIVALN